MCQGTFLLLSHATPTFIAPFCSQDIPSAICQLLIRFLKKRRLSSPMSFYLTLVFIMDGAHHPHPLHAPDHISHRIVSLLYSSTTLLRYFLIVHHAPLFLTFQLSSTHCLLSFVGTTGPSSLHFHIDWGALLDSWACWTSSQLFLLVRHCRLWLVLIHTMLKFSVFSHHPKRIIVPDYILLEVV